MCSLCVSDVLMQEEHDNYNYSSYDIVGDQNCTVLFWKCHVKLKLKSALRLCKTFQDFFKQISNSRNLYCISQKVWVFIARLLKSGVERSTSVAASF